MITTFTATLPLRGRDQYGDGAYGSNRDGGRRKHKGIDITAYPGTVIHAAAPGQVTKLGYPYASDLSFRYVQLTMNGLDYRHFYVLPIPGMAVGDFVLSGQPIGTVQDLTLKYPRMTNHMHFSIRRDRINRINIDPTPFVLGGRDADHA